jgi:hypothetical protein
MFKVNDKVKMRTESPWWNKGDIGRIVEIDNSSVPYYIYFQRKGTWWADETDIRPI